jgi:hypothetical protein
VGCPGAQDARAHDLAAQFELFETEPFTVSAGRGMFPGGVLGARIEIIDIAFFVFVLEPRQIDRSTVGLCRKSQQLGFVSDIDAKDVGGKFDDGGSVGNWTGEHAGLVRDGYSGMRWDRRGLVRSRQRGIGSGVLNR